MKEGGGGGEGGQGSMWNGRNGWLVEGIGSQLMVARSWHAPPHLSSCHSALPTVEEETSHHLIFYRTTASTATVFVMPLYTRVGNLFFLSSLFRSLALRSLALRSFAQNRSF